jgi:cysteine desulfurase
VRRVYFDNASTTKTDPEVLASYEKLLESTYVNSESLYDEGVSVSRMLEKARSAIAGLLAVHPDEIIFTGGSSESNSAAIKGVPLADRQRRHIITTSIEHSSILNSCAQMERLFGYRITYLPVNEQGRIRIEDLKAALDEDTVLVSIMQVNNETGAVNPIREAAELIRRQSHAYFHVDMTQAVGKVDCPMEGIDLASMSAHKIHGLKGSGILVRRAHVKMEPLISGGEQEYGLRGGTSNACTNMVFAKTLRLALEQQKQNDPKIRRLHDQLLEGLQEIEGVEINSPLDGIPETVNFSFEAIPSEVMQNALNQAGFLVSARSTCESKSNNPSYVLKAMGMSDRRASSSIRISLSAENTSEDVQSFLAALKEIIRHYG